MVRTGIERLAAIEPALTRRDKFLASLDGVTDALECADLMAESIEMMIDSNAMEPVGRDGRVMVCAERVFAAHCMIKVRQAYLLARNLPEKTENGCHTEA